jgi:hypothetical protein
VYAFRIRCQNNWKIASRPIQNMLHLRLSAHIDEYYSHKNITDTQPDI